jgi:hypothetical protein
VPKFLSLVSYSGGSLAAMIDSPADREPQVRAVLESVGAELEVFYWMFGAHDGLAIIEAPDSLTMAGVSPQSPAPEPSAARRTRSSRRRTSARSWRPHGRHGRASPSPAIR